MTVSKPRFCGNRAPTCCISRQTLTQRRHLMHLPLSRSKAGVEVSIRLRRLLAVVGDLADAQLGRQGLQLAVLVAVAGLALAVVLGEQQFDHGPAGVADAAGVGEHLHARCGRHRAGSAPGSAPLRPRPRRRGRRRSPAGPPRSRAWGCGCPPASPRRGSWRPSGTSTGTLLMVRSDHRRGCSQRSVNPCSRWRRSAAQLFAVVAAEAAAGLADGHRLAPGHVRPRRNCCAAARRAIRSSFSRGASKGSASGSKAVSTSLVLAPEGVVGAGEVHVDAHGRPLAGGHGLDHRGRSAHGVAAGEDPFLRGLAGDRVGVQEDVVAGLQGEFAEDALRDRASGRWPPAPGRRG